MPEMCAAYLLRRGSRGTEVLLGDSRAVGIGGDLRAGESARDASIRELADRIGVRVAASDLHEAGRIDYHFPTRPSWSRHATVFVCRRFAGDPVELDGVAPRWYAPDAVPYGRMWDDASRWLPGVLHGGTVDARDTFGADLATVVLGAE